MLKTLPLIAAMIISAVVGNLLLKTGATARPPSGLVMMVLHPSVICGLTLFGAAAMLYLLVLQRLPLNVAQSMMALQFVGVMLGSVLVLGEPMPPARLLGAILITTGVIVVGWSNLT
jgi:drug/metabolite transporter (DMT)-like permease